MRKLARIFLLLLISFISVNVYALRECNKNEKQRLRDLAEKVEFLYDYKLEDIVEDGRKITFANFSITASNLNPDLKVTIMEDYFLDKYREFKDGDNSTATLDGFKTGEKVRITIYGFVPNACSGEEILKKTIKLPYYNSFSEDERCEEYPDFKYCSDLIDNSIKESIFNDEFKRFVSVKTDDETIDIDKKNNSAVIIGVLISIISLLVVIISYILRRRKKYSL